MTTTGPNSFSTFLDDSTVGDSSWSNTANASSSNDSYATVSLSPGRGPATSHYLKATGAGFSIPSGNTIVGIQLDVEQKANASGANENSIKLVKGGTISGTNLSTGASVSTTEGYVSWGGPTQLWGLSWTPADINASNFGAAISYTSSSSPVTVSVDHMRITIYHTAGAGAAITATSFFFAA